MKQVNSESRVSLLAALLVDENSDAEGGVSTGEMADLQ
jgi:hypothetical protein